MMGGNYFIVSMNLLSCEKATESTSLVWPTKRRVVDPLLRSHRRRVPSHEPERANCPSELTTTSCKPEENDQKLIAPRMLMTTKKNTCTKWECPFKLRRGWPKEPSSRVSCQTRRVLSRDALTIMVSLSSDGLLRKTITSRANFYAHNIHCTNLAEMAVTQPLWPFIVPGTK